MLTSNRLRTLACAAVSLLTASAVFGADHYIRAGASGSDDGSDWTNAFPTFPTTLVRGDTYYVADGSYGTVVLDDAVSGTSYIYVKKAVEAAHGTETGWDSAYGDGQAEFAQIEVRTAYWDIDGSSGSGTSARGIYIAYAGLYGGIFMSSTTPANKHHLRFRSIEVESVGHSSANVALYYFMSEAEGAADNLNLLVQNCYFHDQGGLHVQAVAGNWVTFEDNVMERSSQWNNASHKEMMKFDSLCANIIIRRNVFRDWQGYSVTGGLIFGGNNITGSMGPVWIYNNVFQWTTQGSELSGGNRMIGGLDSAPNTDHDGFYFYNNTVVGVDQSHAASVFKGGVWTGTRVAYNNLFVECDGLGEINGTEDYNAVYDCPNISLTGGNSLTLGAYPIVSAATLSLVGSSAAVGAGTDLSATFTTDIDGNVRSSWDLGAYEYQTPGGGPTAPSSATLSTGNGWFSIAGFDNSDNEESFLVEWCYDGSSWDLSESISADSASYTRYDLPPSTTVYVRVSSVNGAGTGGPTASTPESASTSAPAPVLRKRGRAAVGVGLF